MGEIINENATCSAQIVQKILAQYKNNNCSDITKSLFKKASEFDFSDPSTQVPLTFVNELINWIEKELGPANLKMVGNIFGETAFEKLKANNILPDNLSPQEVIQKLIYVIQAVINDPSLKNLQVLEVQDNFARIRKTQTFNTTVQIGLIESFIRKAGITFPRTRVVRDYKKGPAYDEYEITWF